MPSLFFSRQMGNIYTGALYTCLISLLSDPALALQNKRILAFSYGSGSAATLFTLTVQPDLRLLGSQMDCRTRLAQRTQVTPEEFHALLDEQEKNFQDPRGESSDRRLFPESYYLLSVDPQYRRVYKQYLTSGATRLQMLSS